MDFKGLKNKYPTVPILALSGSMSPNMIQEYADFLDIHACYLIEKYPDRPNIHYKIVEAPSGKINTIDAVVDYIKEFGYDLATVIFSWTI